MEILEMKAKKLVIEKEITIKLLEFEKESGVRIESVDSFFVSPMGSDGDRFEGFSFTITI